MLSIIAFIKHAQAMPDIGRLIMKGIPIKDHALTNDRNYASHVVKTEGLEKAASDADENTTWTVPTFG